MRRAGRTAAGARERAATSVSDMTARRELTALFEPRSVAVVGASDDAEGAA
jgi:hypothetical protein